VAVNGQVCGRISQGFLIFLGIGKEDGRGDADYLVDKIVHLRIFNDEQGKMNLSLKEVGGKALIVSQFTLYGDCRKGRRPSFTEAAQPAQAEPLYHYFVEQMRNSGIEVATGRFQAMMEVTLLNDGPVTLLLDSRKTF